MGTPPANPAPQAPAPAGAPAPQAPAPTAAPAATPSPLPAEAGALALLVLYTERLEEVRAFYTGLGLTFTPERHGRGPLHHAAVLPGGVVLEIYPATVRRPVTSARLGFTVAAGATAAALPPGRHLLEDPDGRAVEVHAR